MDCKFLHTRQEFLWHWPVHGNIILPGGGVRRLSCMTSGRLPFYIFTSILTLFLDDRVVIDRSRMEHFIAVNVDILVLNWSNKAYLNWNAIVEGNVCKKKNPQWLFRVTLKIPSLRIIVLHHVFGITRQADYSIHTKQPCFFFLAKSNLRPFNHA